VARCAPEGACIEPLREAAVTGPIAVLLVSDDPALRAAWARKLPEGVSEAVDEPPTVILLDGPELVRELGHTRLVVVGPPDPVAVRTVLDAGARGYLFRRPGGERTPTAEWTPVRTAVIELSARELEVLQGVADGRSNGDIGAALQLSPLTVKSHLARIGRKLGTGDRAHAVLLALRAGVIT
jgi:DNA-binding CsgD family transcriptional regulator